MKSALIVFFMGGALFANDSNDKIRQDIEKELVAIMFFANDQAILLEQEYLEQVESDADIHELSLEILKQDKAQYQKISVVADRRIKQMEQGLSLWWAKNYLQLLRNHLYALNPDTNELMELGIKRRSQKLLTSGMQFLSSSTSFLIKCAGTIAAIKTIYGMLPGTEPAIESAVCSRD